MTAQCPSTFRFPCISANSGRPGLTAQELATVLSPFIGGGFSFSGALVYRNTDQAVGIGSTAIIFQAADYDTDSFFSLVNPTRLTITSSEIQKVVISSTIRLLNAPLNSVSFTFMQKNGAAGMIPGLSRQTVSVPAVTNVHINATSAPLSVSLNDYFEIYINSDQAQTINSSNLQTWFSIYRVE